MHQTVVRVRGEGHASVEVKPQATLARWCVVGALRSTQDSRRHFGPNRRERKEWAVPHPSPHSIPEPGHHGETSPYEDCHRDRQVSLGRMRSWPRGESIMSLERYEGPSTLRGAETVVVVVPLGGTADTVFREYVELVSQQCQCIDLNGARTSTVQISSATRIPRIP